jgi:hypothetical protein
MNSKQRNNIIILNTIQVFYSSFVLNLLERRPSGEASSSSPGVFLAAALFFGVGVVLRELDLVAFAADAGAGAAALVGVFDLGLTAEAGAAF